MTTQTRDLPALPEPDSYCTHADSHEYDVFSADQMRKYAIEAIRASATSAPEHGWQPIETAPKSGKESLFMTIEMGQFVLYWDVEEGWSTGLDSHKILTPTHWQPLPPQPAKGA